jgi:hypothetical protein
MLGMRGAGLPGRCKDLPDRRNILKVVLGLFRLSFGGVQKRPSLVVTNWLGHKKAGPLIVSTDHHGTADGKPFRLFLSDVSVKVTGSDNWIDAQ